MSGNKKTPQDVRDQGELGIGQIIILDPNQNVVAIISDNEVIEHSGYHVILDKHEKCKFIYDGTNLKISS